MANDPTVDPEFRSIIPPLSPEERSQLEINIKRDGCREPLVVWAEGGGILLDGHNRFEICKANNVPFAVQPVATRLETRTDAIIWIIENQIGRRNLAPFTRVELALKLEPLVAAKAKQNQGKRNDIVQNSDRSTKRSGHELAKVAGVSHDTIAKGKLVAQHADEETKIKLRTNQISIHRVAKEIKEKIQRETRRKHRIEAASKVAINSRIVVGDFRKHAELVADGSVSLIFTDPPYDRKAEKLFPGLADFAAAKLEEGGSLVMYLGHLQLPAAFDAFKGKLRHWWTCACVHDGDMALMREYGVRAGWKPMLWFVKTTRDNKSDIIIDTVGTVQKKDHHDWQQSEAEAVYFIEHLCPANGVVCDPFIGGGTTAVAAKRLDRKWIGFEINPDTARIASKRLAQ